MPKRTCSNGHVTKGNKATHCPQCGEALPEPVKRKKWPIVVGALGALLICGILALSLGGDKTSDAPAASSSQVSAKATSTPRPSRTPVPTKTPLPTATPKPISDLTYEGLQAERDRMTDAQWDAYREPLKGLRVEWSGWVEEAKDQGSKGQLLIDMDSPETVFSVQDVTFDVPKESILIYNKDQQVTFQGDIKTVTSFLDKVSVTLENAKVVE